MTSYIYFCEYPLILIFLRSICISVVVMTTSVNVRLELALLGMLSNIIHSYSFVYFNLALFMIHMVVCTRIMLVCLGSLIAKR